MKTFYFTDNRFKFIALLLLIIFLIFMAVIWIKADYISKNPCSICAEKIGKNVVCYAGIGERIFYENGTIETLLPGG